MYFNFQTTVRICTTLIYYFWLTVVFLAGVNSLHPAAICTMGHPRLKYLVSLSLDLALEARGNSIIRVGMLPQSDFKFIYYLYSNGLQRACWVVHSQQ